MPCYIDKKVVESRLFLNGDFVMPSLYQLMQIIFDNQNNEDMGIIQLATILMKSPNLPPFGSQAPLFWAISRRKIDIIKILAPYESSTNIHYILKEFVRNQDIIDTLAPFEYN